MGTIALPMAFLASSFGQSFDWLTDRIATGWALALPGAMMYCMLLACALVPPSAAALADLSARRPRARGARS